MTRVVGVAADQGAPTCPVLSCRTHAVGHGVRPHYLRPRGSGSTCYGPWRGAQQRLVCQFCRHLIVSEKGHVEWKLMYFALRKQYPPREQYGDTLHFCRHCSILFWKVPAGGRPGSAVGVRGVPGRARGDLTGGRAGDRVMR